MQYIKSLRVALDMDGISMYSIATLAPKKILFFKIPGNISVVLSGINIQSVTINYYPEDIRNYTILFNDIEKELAEIFCSTSDKIEDKPSVTLEDVKCLDELPK